MIRVIRWGIGSPTVATTDGTSASSFSWMRLEQYCTCEDHLPVLRHCYHKNAIVGCRGFVGCNCAPCLQMGFMQVDEIVLECWSYRINGEGEYWDQQDEPSRIQEHEP